jgi:hypothetical protein
MHANAPSGRAAGACLEAAHRRIDHSGPSACIPSDPRASALNPACLASWLRREAASFTALRAACTGHRLRHHWHVRATQCRIGSASRWLSVRFVRTGPCVAATRGSWRLTQNVRVVRRFDRSAVQQYRRHALPRVPWRASKRHSRSRTQFSDLADKLLFLSQVSLVLGNVREALDQQAGLCLRLGGGRPGSGAVTGRS